MVESWSALNIISNFIAMLVMCSMNSIKCLESYGRSVLDIFCIIWHMKVWLVGRLWHLSGSDVQCDGTCEAWECVNTLQHSQGTVHNHPSLFTHQDKSSRSAFLWGHPCHFCFWGAKAMHCQPLVLAKLLQNCHNSFRYRDNKENMEALIILHENNIKHSFTSQLPCAVANTFPVL